MPIFYAATLDPRILRFRFVPHATVYFPGKDRPRLSRNAAKRRSHRRDCVLRLAELFLIVGESLRSMSKAPRLPATRSRFVVRRQRSKPPLSRRRISAIRFLREKIQWSSGKKEEWSFRLGTISSWSKLWTTFSVWRIEHSLSFEKFSSYIFFVLPVFLFVSFHLRREKPSFFDWLPFRFAIRFSAR